MAQQQVFDLKLAYGEYKGKMQLSRYAATGNIAVLFIDPDSDEPLATATVDLGEKLPKGYITIKNYSEGEGMYQTMLDAGIVDGGEEIGVGPFRASVWMAKLTQKAYTDAALINI